MNMAVRLLAAICIFLAAAGAPRLEAAIDPVILAEMQANVIAAHTAWSNVVANVDYLRGEYDAMYYQLVYYEDFLRELLQMEFQGERVLQLIGYCESQISMYRLLCDDLDRQITSEIKRAIILWNVFDAQREAMNDYILQNG